MKTDEEEESTGNNELGLKLGGFKYWIASIFSSAALFDGPRLAINGS